MTRARILNCAKELYYENGFDKTTIQAIADKAGSTLGSMTYHFSTKADFVDTLFSDYHGAIEQTIDTVAPRMKHSEFIRKQSSFCTVFITTISLLILKSPSSITKS